MTGFIELFFDHPHLLLSNITVRNALKDVFMNDVGLINVLVIAYDCIHVLDEIQKDHPDLEMEKGKWTLRIINEYYIKDDKAAEAVDIWCELFTKEMAVKVKEEIRKARKEKVEEAERQKNKAIEQKKETEEKRVQYRTRFDGALSSNQFDEADSIIHSAEDEGFFEFSVLRSAVKERKEQVEQEKLLAGGSFVSYAEGIRIAAQILERNPESVLAKVWLQNHPRTEKIIASKLSFKDGNNQATISWEDDDPYSTYTVCRAEGRYPSDPSDGIVVCKNVSNKKVTDNLPENKPGIKLFYSIFAVRILDGRWIKEDCPGEAIWLPAPEELKAELIEDRYGRRAVSIAWKRIPVGCAGVSIIRYNSEDAFSFPDIMLNIDDRYADVQRACKYIDYDINPRTKYQYWISQIWKYGNNQRESSIVKKSITIE